MGVRALLAALPLLGSCAPPAAQIPYSTQCEGNTAPFIGSLKIDSACIVSSPPTDCTTEEGQQALENGEEPEWSLFVEFLYADPGVNGASDPANMVGGMVSGEISLGQLGSLWIYDPLEHDPGENPNYVPVDREATTGLLVLPRLIPEIPVEHYSPATMAFRVRDACDAQSNDINCRYSMGTGEWIDCVPPAADQ